MSKETPSAKAVTPRAMLALMPAAATSWQISSQNIYMSARQVVPEAIILAQAQSRGGSGWPGRPTCPPREDEVLEPVVEVVAVP